MLSATEYFCAHRKFLLFNLLSRNLKVRYRKSLLGMLWTLLIPAGSAAIYFVIFQFVLKVKIDNYLLVILSGIIPWTFFSAVIAGLEVIVANYALLNKVPLPPHALVMAETLTHFLNLILSLPIILFVFFASGFAPNLAMMQYLPLIVLLFFTAYALSLILGLTYVYFRDLRYIVQLILQFWFYLTPVMYKVEMIPPDYAFFIYLNPVGTIFAGFHESIADGRWLSPTTWLSSILWCVGMNLVAIFLLDRSRYKIIESL